MAWPETGVWEARVSGTTTVKKAWADAIDGALNSIFGATGTLTGVAFGSTGNTAITRPGSGALRPYIYIDGVPTDRQLVDMWAVTTAGGVGTVYFRRYQTSNGIEETVNAIYGSGGTPWSQDSSAWESRRRKVAYSGDAEEWQYQTAGHAAWADGSWLNRVLFTFEGPTFGKSGSGYAQGHVRAGRLTVRKGTAYAGTDITIDASWGAGRSVISIDADDSGGYATIGAAGAGIAADPTVTVTFKDGAFDNAPMVIAVLAASDEAGIDCKMVQTSGVVTTGFAMTLKHTPAAGKSYRLHWLVIGR